MSFGGSPSLFRTTQWHVVTQCLFRGGHGRWLVLFAASAGVAVASTARPNTGAMVLFMVPSRELVVDIYGYDLRGPERSESLADQVRPVLVPVVALVTVPVLTREDTGIWQHETAGNSQRCVGQQLLNREHVLLDRYPFGRPLHLVSLALAAVAPTAPSDVFLAVDVADVGTVAGAAADWARSRVDIPGVVLGFVVRAPDSGPPATDCPVVPPSAVFFGVVVPALFERRERLGYGLLHGRAGELGTDNHADQFMHGGFPPGSYASSRRLTAWTMSVAPRTRWNIHSHSGWRPWAWMSAFAWFRPTWRALRSRASEASASLARVSAMIRRSHSIGSYSPLSVVSAIGSGLHPDQEPG